MEEKKCIVSIFADGIPNVGIYKGCGVCIGERLIITVEHVIRGLNKSQITIGAIPDHDKGMKVSEIFIHPEKDIAILKLHHPHQKDILSCLMEEEPVHNKVYSLLTYNQGEGGIKIRPDIHITNSIREGGWEITHGPNPGESGGAVLSDGKLIAILRAEDIGEKTGLIVSLFEIRDFLKGYLVHPQNDHNRDTLSDEELTRIQIKAIAKHLNHIDAKEVSKAVAVHFIGLGSKESDGEVLAKQIVDFKNTQGRLPLLNKLITLSAELVKEGCQKLSCEHLDLLFSEVLLVTTPLDELKKCQSHSSGVIKLSLRTETAVEVYLSRLFKAAPQFKRIRDKTGKVIAVMGKCGFSFDSDDIHSQQQEHNTEKISLPESGWEPGITTDIVEKTIKTAIDGRYEHARLDDFRYRRGQS